MPQNHQKKNKNTRRLSNKQLTKTKKSSAKLPGVESFGQLLLGWRHQIPCRNGICGIEADDGGGALQHLAEIIRKLCPGGLTVGRTFTLCLPSWKTTADKTKMAANLGIKCCTTFLWLQMDQEKTESSKTDMVNMSHQT